MIRKYFLRMLIISIGILFTVNVSAQNNIVMHGDTMNVNNEAKFWLNQIVYFGVGTMPDRTYSYIYEAPNGIQKIINNHKRKLLGAGYRGFKSKVVKFEKEVGHNKKGYDYSILVLEMPDGKRYWCDVVNAYNNHEIALKEPETPAAPITKAQDNAPTKSNNKKPAKAKTTKKDEPLEAF